MYVWGLHHWGNAWILAFVVNNIISNNYFMKFCWKAFQESLPSYYNDMGSVSMRSCLLIACRIGIWGGNCCGGANGCGEGETFAVVVVPVVDFVVTVVLDMSVAAIVAAETAAIVAVLVEWNWMHPDSNDVIPLDAREFPMTFSGSFFICVTDGI